MKVKVGVSNPRSFAEVFIDKAAMNRIEKGQPPPASVAEAGDMERSRMVRRLNRKRYQRENP